MDMKDTSYKHTQIGYLIIFVMFGVFILFWTVLFQAGYDIFVTAIMLFILVVLISFTSLSVTIDKEYLRIKFGYGIFKMKFLLKEINTAKTAKHHWYYGWGIRLWFWPRMLTLNVSGFDVVEITMKNGKIYRIGTDEPKKLEQAISQALRRS
jgi:hypothetical protein